MKVEGHDYGFGKRILVGDTSLTVEQATALRDALTRELGAPLALTEGERCVWAAAFVCSLDRGARLISCSQRAATAVQELRNAAACGEELPADARLMLLAMTGGGR